MQMEIALRVGDAGSVAFVRFDEHRRRFVTVTRDEVEARHRLLSSDSTDLSAPIVDPTRSRRIRLGAWIRSRAPSRLRVEVPLRMAWAVEKSIVAAARSATSAFERLVTIGRPVERLRRCTPGGRRGDVVLCLTLHQGVGAIEALEAWVDGRGMELVTIVYDVIPSITPEFSTFDPSEFDLFVCEIAALSTRLLTISECSATDLGDLCVRHGVDLPPIDVIRLASGLADVPPKRPEISDLPDEFVLCVGTIEPRKNHALLLDVWASFARDEIDDAPVLVIAGAEGWLVDETMRRIESATGPGGNVVFVDSPSDPELHWLYRNCAFTLFPSLYEGWGLPVTESFDTAKACVTTDRGSLPEAGEGLAVHLDALDRAAWRREILDLWRDDDRRRAMEDHIARSRGRRTVPDVVADLAAVLDRVGWGTDAPAATSD